MPPFHCIILCDRKNLSLHVCTLCISIFAFKMTTELICLQDELPMVLITTLDLKTFIKGHHVDKDIWTPKQGERLDVLIEPDNLMDKFAVCVKINEKIEGHLKKCTSGRFAKTIFYFLRIDAYWSVWAKATGKRYWQKMVRENECSSNLRFDLTSDFYNEVLGNVGKMCRWVWTCIEPSPFFI